MSEFAIRNYDTNYQYASYVDAKDIPAIKKNDFKIHEHDYCFSSLFHDSAGNKHIIIKIYSGIKYLKETHGDNACLFTKAEIERHIRVAKKLFNFEYTISKRHQLDSNFVGYEVSLTVPDENGVYVKYLVTWVRYLYEFPFNVSLLDAYRLKRLPGFKSMTIENLLLVVLNCHKIGDGWVRGIHSVPKPGNGFFFTTRELKKKLIELSKRGKNIYGILNQVYPQAFKGISLLDENSYGNPTELSRWKSEELFLKRVEVYKKVIELNKRQKKTEINEHEPQ